MGSYRDEDDYSWLGSLLLLTGLVAFGRHEKKKREREEKEVEDYIRETKRKIQEETERKNKEYEERMRRLEIEAEMRRQETIKRRNTICYFTNGVSYEQFQNCVYAYAKKIKRIENVRIDGPFVFVTVRTKSGISTWNFEIDFNDYGKITGEYWIYRDNLDSNLPEGLAKSIQKELLSILPKQDNDFFVEDDYDFDYTSSFNNLNTDNLDCDYFKQECGDVDEDVQFETNKPEQEKNPSKILLPLFAMLALMTFVAFGFSLISNANMASLNYSSNELKGKHYSEVLNILEDAGFENVTTVIEYDIINEWLVKNGEVEFVSIDGDKRFNEDDEFSKDAKIIVSYHTYKQKKQ